jgi:hypothetical protein
MHKVRIDVAGWEAFTDLFGGVPFENGVSTRPLTPQEENRIGACIRVVRLDNDEQVGAATVMAESRNVSAEVVPALSNASEQPKEEIIPKYTKRNLKRLLQRVALKQSEKLQKNLTLKALKFLR